MVGSLFRFIMSFAWWAVYYDHQFPVAMTRHGGILLGMNNLSLNGNVRGGLRTNSDFLRPRVNTVHFGKDSLRYFGSVIWDKVPIQIKNSINLSIFKSKIRNWSPDECPCRLCQVYLHRLGYTNVVV